MSLPVIVVGNLSVGGTGKTPLCGKLVEIFSDAGWRPAIVSRGYGGQRHDRPHLVVESDTAVKVGDEPLMLFQQTKFPVCVCIDRAAAVEHLAANTDANIIISDDGLQHLALARDAQIITIDAFKGFGNRWLLPAGPLRNRIGRLREANFVALQTRFSDDDYRHRSLMSVNADGQPLTACLNTFSLIPEIAVALDTGEKFSMHTFGSGKIHAVAGIGNPARFFMALKRLGLDIIEHAFSDHHKYSLKDTWFQDGYPVFVTSKDAVKLRPLYDRSERHDNRIYEITTKIVISDGLEKHIKQLERSLSHSRRC